MRTNTSPCLYFLKLHPETDCRIILYRKFKGWFINPSTLSFMTQPVWANFCGFRTKVNIGLPQVGSSSKVNLLLWFVWIKPRESFDPFGQCLNLLSPLKKVYTHNYMVYICFNCRSLPPGPLAVAPLGYYHQHQHQQFPILRRLSRAEKQIEWRQLGA